MMKRLLAITGSIVLTILSAFIFDIPGAFFTGSLSVLVLNQCKTARVI